MKTIEIFPYTHIGTDERGNTAELTLDRGGNMLSIFRKQGTVFGNHYHTGISASKNPEIFWLLHGEAIIEHKLLDDQQWISTTLLAPTKVFFYPNVIHKVTAVTDCYMIELNSLEDHINDTTRV